MSNLNSLIPAITGLVVAVTGLITVIRHIRSPHPHSLGKVTMADPKARDRQV